MQPELPFLTVADPADLESAPVALDPPEAQRWCNFVLWTPAGVPADCVLAVGTLRKEAPPGRHADATEGRTPWTTNNASAYRFEVVGCGRRLRIKQFFYDWAFPALDHPCLWKSTTRAVALDESHVLWYGTDYLHKRAASARLGRTTVELSVIEGEFSDAEILALYRALRPASADAAARIERTPFASLSYWARRTDAPMVVVPTGLWKFHRKAEGVDHEGDWLVPPDTDALLAKLALPATLGGLPVDSAATFADGDGRSEIEVVYAGGPRRGRELRLIAQEDGKGRLVAPAEPEDHPGTRVTDTVAGATVQLAWIDERYGPFDAVLRVPGGNVVVKLLSSTGVGLDTVWFRQAVTDLVEALGHAAPALR